MTAARLSCLALCAGLAGLTLAQSPAGRVPTQGDARKQSFYSDRVDAATHAAMQGVWRVELIDWNGERLGGRDVAGYALIDEGHLALEIHVRVFINDSQEVMFQTGIYRYQFGATGEMEAIALIGSDNMALGLPSAFDPLEVSQTPPGTLSRFRVRLAQDVLILDRPTSRLQLRRTVQPHPPFYQPPEKTPPEVKAPPEEGAGD